MTAGRDCVVQPSLQWAFLDAHVQPGCHQASTISAPSPTQGSRVRAHGAVQQQVEQAMTKCIMLIRHAEKPDGFDGGVNESGAPQPLSLSVQGWRRAGALIPYFSALAERLHPGVLDRPQYILAARPTSRHPSTRPRDTVEGLADRLGMVVDESWSDQDPVEKFALQLKAMDAPLLVCWRHDALPGLGRAITSSDEVPLAWPAERFDLTWSFRCDAGVWSFHQVPQLLLAGDRLRPIDWQPERRLGKQSGQRAA